MIKITKENFEAEVEKCESLVVIDLYADWCGPCKMLAPVLLELEGEYPSVKFGKINVDEESELAAAFKVKSIPMIALVKDNTHRPNVFPPRGLQHLPRSIGSAPLDA